MTLKARALSSSTLVDLPRLSDYLGQPLLLAPLGQSRFIDQLGGSAQPALGSLISQFLNGVSAIMPSMGAAAPQYRYLASAELNGGGEGARPLWDDLTDGVATIRISGPLYDRAIVGSRKDEIYIYRDGYDRISTAHAQAQLDPAVQGIIMEYDTPGGLVKDCFEACDYILESKSQGAKPVWGIVTGCAASAGYALASCCDRIYASKTALTGSIGVIVLLSDSTGWDDKIGVRPIPITFGDNKADGGFYKGFDEDEAARIQSVIRPTGEVFVSHVSKSRGISEEDVLGQQASVFTGTDGQNAGLVDVIANPRAARAAFLSFLKGGESVAATPARAPASAAAQTNLKKETDMSLKAELEKLLAAGNSTLDLNQKSTLSLAMKTAEENDKDSQAEGEDDDPKAEGEDDDPKAEGEDGDPKAEGEDDDPKAEGDDDDPKAEGDEDDPKAEDEEEDATARALVIMRAGNAAGCAAFAEKLVQNKKLSSAEALDMIKTAPKAAGAELATILANAPAPINGSQPSEGDANAASNDPSKRIAAARAANPKLRIGRGK